MICYIHPCFTYCSFTKFALLKLEHILSISLQSHRSPMSGNSELSGTLVVHMPHLSGSTTFQSMIRFCRNRKKGFCAQKMKEYICKRTCVFHIWQQMSLLIKLQIRSLVSQQRDKLHSVSFGKMLCGVSVNKHAKRWKRSSKAFTKHV